MKKAKNNNALPAINSYCTIIDPNTRGFFRVAVDSCHGYEKYILLKFDLDKILIHSGPYEDMETLRKFILLDMPRARLFQRGDMDRLVHLYF